MSLYKNNELTLLLIIVQTLSKKVTSLATKIKCNPLRISLANQFNCSTLIYCYSTILWNI